MGHRAVAEYDLSQHAVVLGVVLRLSHLLAHDLGAGSGKPSACPVPLAICRTSDDPRRVTA